MFGENLKKYREKAGLSRSQMAEKLGMTSPTYGFYELNKRNPNGEMLVKISKVLNVSIDVLLDNHLNKFEYYKNLLEGVADVSIMKDGKVIITLTPEAPNISLIVTKNTFMRMVHDCYFDRDHFNKEFRNRVMLYYIDDVYSDDQQPRHWLFDLVPPDDNNE